jgi:hypothetical protein
MSYAMDNYSWRLPLKLHMKETKGRETQVTHTNIIPTIVYNEWSHSSIVSTRWTCIENANHG